MNKGEKLLKNRIFDPQDPLSRELTPLFDKEVTPLEEECAKYLASLKIPYITINWQYKPNKLHFNTADWGPLVYIPTFRLKISLAEPIRPMSYKQTTDAWIQCDESPTDRTKACMKNFTEYVSRKEMILIQNNKEFHKIDEYLKQYDT